MNASDLLKPGAVVLGIAAVGALGFAAGFVVARDPQVLRRVARALAGGVERVAGALAESREELADLWAEVREDARQDIEAQAFASASVAAASASSVKSESMPEPGHRQRREQAALISLILEIRQNVVQHDVEELDPRGVIAIEPPVLHQLHREFERFVVEAVEFRERKLVFLCEGRGQARQRFRRLPFRVFFQVLPNFLDGVHC